jgi:hypothetical protein
MLTPHLGFKLLVSFFHFTHSNVLNGYISVRISVNETVPAAAASILNACGSELTHRPMENKGPEMREDSATSNLP